ncbi:zinc finger protein 729 [Frankliniella occidentalis]|uniref:Zinc finger protein 729 n=1 Tax=Frankliniella occidentalis TaxID=133901 RepID=A0A6J1SVE4_FRAOC|nr:zinc finger protein 729 [Frankliniella occidentalis]XP_026284848.1 zinc finger protein 729 [Frankliniella occidentalis]XP_052125114.1 zinc finger protein 729 [Frankliniella occidentalis]
MRGTVLKLKSYTYIDSSSPDDVSGEEGQNFDSWGDKKKCAPKSPTEEDRRSQDVNKNILMSNLELQSASSPVKQVAPCLSKKAKAPFQRPVFDWDDETMWKAMSRHPLFAKYMELQSQLHKLFEEIRLDCKKAACEKAFAVLVKDSADSPIQVTSIIVEPKFPIESPPKKRGRPIKKRPGRPRKYPQTNSTDWSPNITTVTPLKPPRKCRDEIYLSRKPSWICQNCARCFSSARWLDRHKSVCSFSKLSNLDTNADDKKQDASQTSNLNASLLSDLSAAVGDMDRSVSQVETSEVLQMLSDSCYSVVKAEPLSPSYQIHDSIPLQPKMENLNDTETDELPLGTSFDDDSQCIDEEASALCCGKCKQQFTIEDHLERHWEEQPECKLYVTHESNVESTNYSSDSNVSACKHCGKVFRRHKLLKRHQSMCHVKSKKKLWQCIHCFKAFSRQMHHEQHQRECTSKGKHYGKEAQRCENCSLLFPTQKKLLKHQAICCPDSNNHMIKLLKCLKCSLVFPSYKKQLKHRAECCPDSDTDEMVCCRCSKVLIMRDRMAAHKKKCCKSSKKFQ